MKWIAVLTRVIPGSTRCIEICCLVMPAKKVPAQVAKKLCDGVFNIILKQGAYKVFCLYRTANF